MRFKNLERNPKEFPSRTISASGGLALLQMVSESDTGRCVSEEAESQMGLNTRRCANKDAGSRKRVDWGVQHRLEKEKSVS